MEYLIRITATDLLRIQSLIDRDVKKRALERSTYTATTPGAKGYRNVKPPITYQIVSAIYPQGIYNLERPVSSLEIIGSTQIPITGQSPMNSESSRMSTHPASGSLVHT